MTNKVFDLLNKIPNSTVDETHEVANKINRMDDAATNADITTIKADITAIKDTMATKTDLAKLETRMTWKMIILGIAIVGFRYFGGG